MASSNRATRTPLFVGAACALSALTLMVAPVNASHATAAPPDSGCSTDPTAARLAVRDARDSGDITTAQAASIERDLRSRLATRAHSSTGLRIRASLSTLALAASSVTVPVYVNVIRSGTAVSQGNVTDAMVSAQIAALNTAHRNAHSAFVFKLVSTSRTTNTVWFTATQGSVAESAMKRSLHRGGTDALNLYTLNVPGVLGWSTLPSSASSNLLNDGVVVRFTTLPGGTYVGYNSGDTAVHEVGHWFGLYHVFQGGCTTPGDYIGDTPAQAYAEYSCGFSDSCTASGTDPVNNFMGYTPDSCMYTFTTGQATRMSDAWEAYRA